MLFENEPLRTALYNATQKQHSSLNKHPLLCKIFEKESDFIYYENILICYFHLYENIENSIFYFINNNQIEFDYCQRKKTSLIEQDIKYLKLEDLQKKSSNKQLMPSININNINQLIGLLYVIEGSTLGANYIAKILSKNYGLTMNSGARFFYGYGEETAYFWDDFLEFAQHASQSMKKFDESIKMAVYIFDLFKLHLDYYWKNLQYQENFCNS